MTAVNKDMITIWVADVDASPADCIKTGTPTGDQVLPWKGDITNFAQSGGSAQSEQRQCFGGNQTIDKPRDAYEISLDVNPTVENLTRWATLSLVEDSSNVGVYTSRLLPSDVCIFLEVYDSASSTYYSYAWNNANITTSDDTWSAEDGQALSLNAVVPTDSSGVANHMWTVGAVTTLPEWSALDGN